MRSFAATMPKDIWQEGRFADTTLVDDTRIRVGDRVVLAFVEPADISGAFEVKPDGAVDVRRVGAVIGRGKTPAQAGEAARARIAEVRVSEGLTNTRDDDLRWVRARPSVVQVAGKVRSAIVAEGASSLDAAIAQAGAGPSPGAWARREGPGGFTRRTRAELEATGLNDGDIVVVP